MNRVKSTLPRLGSPIFQQEDECLMFFQFDVIQHTFLTCLFNTFFLKSFKRTWIARFLWHIFMQQNHSHRFRVVHSDPPMLWCSKLYWWCLNALLWYVISWLNFPTFGNRQFKQKIQKVAWRKRKLNFCLRPTATCLSKRLVMDVLDVELVVAEVAVVVMLVTWFATEIPLMCKWP